MMLKRKSNPMARLKYLFVLPLAAMAIVAFARPEISRELEKISTVKFSELVPTKETTVAKSIEKNTAIPPDTAKRAVKTVIVKKDKTSGDDSPDNMIVHIVDWTDKDVDVKTHLDDLKFNFNTNIDLSLDSSFFHYHFSGDQLQQLEALKDLKIDTAMLKKGQQIVIQMQKEGYNMPNIQYDIQSMKELNVNMDSSQIVKIKDLIAKVEVKNMVTADQINAIKNLDIIKLDTANMKKIIQYNFTYENNPGESDGKELATFFTFVSDTDRCPLLIVNGVEITSDALKEVKPSTVKSIDVLKDEKAMDIYGEKGKNGVVIIKTN